MRTVMRTGLTKGDGPARPSHAYETDNRAIEDANSFSRNLFIHSRDASIQI